MEQLIEFVRELADDNAEPYEFSDDQIKRFINKYRKPVYQLPVYAETPDNLVYRVGYKNLSGFVLMNSSSQIDAGEYELDAINGIVTFSQAQDSTLYATFACHQLQQTAAFIWYVRAAKARGMGAYQLGDQKLPQGKESVEFCVKKYWELRQSSSGQMTR